MPSLSLHSLRRVFFLKKKRIFFSVFIFFSILILILFFSLKLQAEFSSPFSPPPSTPIFNKAAAVSAGAGAAVRSIMPDRENAGNVQQRTMHTTSNSYRTFYYYHNIFLSSSPHTYIKIYPILKIIYQFFIFYFIKFFLSTPQFLFNIIVIIFIYLFCFLIEENWIFVSPFFIFFFEAFV